jgi:hypothetical protein
MYAVHRGQAVHQYTCSSTSVYMYKHCVDIHADWVRAPYARRPSETAITPLRRSSISTSSPSSTSGSHRSANSDSESRSGLLPSTIHGERGCVRLCIHGYQCGSRMCGYLKTKGLSHAELQGSYHYHAHVRSGHIYTMRMSLLLLAHVQICMLDDVYAHSMRMWCRHVYIVAWRTRYICHKYECVYSHTYKCIHMCTSRRHESAGNFGANLASAGNTCTQCHSQTQYSGYCHQESDLSISIRGAGVRENACSLFRNISWRGCGAKLPVHEHLGGNSARK